MRRVVGGMVVFLVLGASCSGGNSDLETATLPVLADAEPTTSTDTGLEAESAPTTATAAPPESGQPTATVAPLRVEAIEPFCWEVRDDRNRVVELCARDLGFPAIRGAAFDPDGAGLAIVDPDVTTVVAHVWGEGQFTLEVESSGGVSFVTAPYVNEFEAIGADGQRHRHAPDAPGFVGDDAILIGGGDVDFNGVVSSWRLFFTRSDQVCIQWPTLNGPPALRCAGEDERYATSASWFATDVDTYCFPAEVGFVAVVAAVDEDTTASIEVGGSGYGAPADTLPDGRHIAHAVVGFPAGMFETASFAYEVEGQQRRTDIPLPGLAPPVEEYPQGCPDLGPPRERDWAYPTTPPFRYPSQ